MNRRPGPLISLARRARQRLVSEISRRRYRDAAGNAMPTAMVVGAGRSGTTWLAEMVDAEIPCRLLFEPFNPEQVSAFSRFEYFQYMPPDEENAPLLSYCSALVRGEIHGTWIDSHLAHVHPRLRLIKDIRPTLMLRWFHERFPDVPIVYMLRHPCAVVLSRLRLGWATDDDVRRFLRQPRLVSDHLFAYMEVIERVTTDEEKHALVWCLSNLLPLQQFARGGWTLVRYEALCERPDAELARVLGAFGVKSTGRALAASRLPSRTVRHARRASGARDDNGSWTRHLTTAQIDRVLAVVAAFGLDHLYGDAAMPTARERATGRAPSESWA